MKRIHVLALIGLAALLLAVLGITLASPHKAEPTFCGRTVTQWLTSRDYETNKAAVSLAVVAIGEASVPALRRMLYSGTKWDRMWFAKAPRWLYRRLPVGGYQFDRKDRAMWALQNLGRAGRQATPDLLAILQDTTEHWNQRVGAMITLRSIEADPSVVLPVMDRLKSDAVVGAFAASEARSLRGSPEQQQYRELQKSLAAGRSVQTDPPKPAFQPSSSFLNQNSLWRPANSKPTKFSSGTNPALTLLGALGRSATNISPAEPNNTKIPGLRGLSGETTVWFP